MGKKDKKEKRKSEGADDSEGEKSEKVTWEDKIRYLSPISQPLASKKLTKKLCKTLKKAAKVKQVRQGIKLVCKCVRKGEKGIIVLAGDVSPVDVISHMPITCEEAGIPYCYIPAKEDLGAACGKRGPIVMVMLKSHEDYQDAYDECYESVKNLPLPL